MSRRRSPASRRLLAAATLLASACCVWQFAVAPGARAGTTCGAGAPTALLSGAYSGTWTYNRTEPQGSGQPDEVEQISLSWKESYNGQTGCWTLLSAGGAASLSGAVEHPKTTDCSATIKPAQGAENNFLSDQMSSSGQYPYLTQTDPATGDVDTTHWFVDEYAPNFYGDPEGVLRSTDHTPGEWCYQPLNGYQPTVNPQFTGTGCHIGPYYAGGTIDFLTFPANGSDTGNDSCQYMSTDATGATTQETLEQSITMSSRTSTCSDVSASTTEDTPVTVELVCTNPTNSQLDYFVLTPPRHAAKVTVIGDQVTYTPVHGFTGTDAFNYFAKPPSGLQGNDAMVTIIVTPPVGSPKPPTGPGSPKHKKPGHPGKPRHPGKRHKHNGHGHKRRTPATVCKVPRVKGRTLAGAKASLRRAHCAVGKVTRRKSPVLARGRVIASSPRPATRHRAGTKVRLTVSLGH